MNFNLNWKSIRYKAELSDLHCKTLSMRNSMIVECKVVKVQYVLPTVYYGEVTQFLDQSSCLSRFYVANIARVYQHFNEKLKQVSKSLKSVSLGRSGQYMEKKLDLWIKQMQLFNTLKYFKIIVMYSIID